MSRRARFRALLVDVTPLRLDRDYRFWWSGQLVSATGNQATRVALRYHVYVLTGSVLAVGALTLVQFFGVLVFALAGGSLADAFDRRKVLLATHVAMCLTSVSLLVVAQLDPVPLPLVFALAFVSGGLGAVDLAVRGSAIPRLVPRERLQSAFALNQLNGRSGSIVGPAIGGVLIASFGPQGVYAFDALTFVASLAALLAIAPILPHPSAPRPGFKAIRQGLAYVLRRRLIRSALLLDVVATVFAMPTSLFPALALDVFRVGPVGFGFLAAAPSVGALVAVFLSGWIGRLRRAGRALVSSYVVWGGAITVFGLLTFSFPVALLALAIAGAADVISAVLRTTIVQFETPDRLRGRVTSVVSMTVQSGSRLGDIEAALVAAIAGTQVSVVTGGLACLVAVLAVIRARPELAAYEVRTREPAVAPAAAIQAAGDP